MSKQETLDLINQSILSLMEFARQTKEPIKGFRTRDLSILIYIFKANEKHMITMSDLARSLRVTPAAASQIISGYEKNGWVTRVRSQEDRRTVYIQIADEIRDKLLMKWNEHMEALSQFLDELGPEDCENLRRILTKVIECFHKTILHEGSNE